MPTGTCPAAQSVAGSFWPAAGWPLLFSSTPLEPAQLLGKADSGVGPCLMGRGSSFSHSGDLGFPLPGGQSHLQKGRFFTVGSSPRSQSGPGSAGSSLELGSLIGSPPAPPIAAAPALRSQDPGFFPLWVLPPSSTCGLHVPSLGPFPEPSSQSPVLPPLSPGLRLLFPRAGMSSPISKAQCARAGQLSFVRAS